MKTDNVELAGALGLVGSMKDGLIFKKDGVMTPEKFLHGGPINGWRIR